MKLANALKILLSIQLLTFGWLLILMGSEDDGLGGLVPLGLFGLAGLVNLVVFVAYLVRLAIRRQSINFPVVILVSLNILVVIFYDPLTDWAAANL